MGRIGTIAVSIETGARRNGDGGEEVSGSPDSRFATVIDQLSGASSRQTRLSVVFGVASVVATVGGILFLAQQASAGNARIQSTIALGASDTAVTAQAIYLIVRGTGTAAIVGGIVYFMLGLARSSLDQATRYEKRLIASNLIDYALHEREVDAAKLEAAHKIIEVWGSTVESAYTPPRVAKRVGGMKVNVSRDGGSVESDSNSP